MPIFTLIIETAVQFFASWTIAYHLALLTRLPAQLSLLLLLTIFPTSFFFDRHRLKSLKVSLRQLRNPLALGVFSFCLLLGLLTCFGSRPDFDDFSFFHRVLVQLQHLDQPFFLTDTSHNLPGLPALSLTHTMTSYEPLVGLAANWLKLDPVWAYQNLSAFVVAFLLPLVYFSLYRQFRLRYRFHRDNYCRSISMPGWQPPSFLR
jgi:hypothetical protein